MFEISIFCFILFAIAYWTTLFIMGRREDVLHGEFVEAEPELAPVPLGAPTGVVIAESVPQTAPAPVARVASIPTAALAVAATPAPVAASAPAPQPVPARRPVNPEKLQSLLASIKQELKNAAQI